MKTKEIKRLLQLFFNGESSENDEKVLHTYFQSGKVANELKQYAEFFGGLSELTQLADDDTIEDDIMDFILENEHTEKTKFKKLWMNVTAIAASIVIVLGGFLFYQQQKQPFEDTFDTPEEAYVYATQTLRFVSKKYNKGFAELSNFEKLQAANKPLKIGVEPVNEFFESIKKMEENK